MNDTENENPLFDLTPEDLEAPRETGHVKWFDEVRNYGFIKREGGSDVFLHGSNISHEPPLLKENDMVEFTVIPGEKGPVAQNVTLVTSALPD